MALFVGIKDLGACGLTAAPVNGERDACVRMTWREPQPQPIYFAVGLFLSAPIYSFGSKELCFQKKT